MPNVRGGGQTQRGGYHNSTDIKKTMRPEFARDDIGDAFAGEENKGPASNEKLTTEHDSHKKSRKLVSDSEKTPIK